MSHSNQSDGQAFDLDGELEAKVFQEKDWEKRVNNLWDVCQRHLDHDLDRARLAKDPQQVVAMIRDGMQQWNKHRQRIVSTVVAGP